MGELGGACLLFPGSLLTSPANRTLPVAFRKDSSECRSPWIYHTQTTQGSVLVQCSPQTRALSGSELCSEVSRPIWHLALESTLALEFPPKQCSPDPPSPPLLIRCSVEPRFKSQVRVNTEGVIVKDNAAAGVELVPKVYVKKPKFQEIGCPKPSDVKGCVPIWKSLSLHSLS